MNESPRTPSDLPAAGEAWFRVLFEKSADAMALLDPGTLTFVDCNEASAQAIRAPSRQALIGRRPTDMTAQHQPDGRSSSDFIDDIVCKVLAEGSHRFEWQMRRLDGTMTWSEIVATAISLEGRTLIFTTSRNIEERKRIENELRVSEQRWRRVFEQIPFSMQIFAPDGSTRQVNRAYEELFQLSLHDLEHFNIRTDTQLSAAGLAHLIEQAFTGAAVTLPAIPFELRARPDQPARGVRWIGSTLFPVLDASGSVIEVVCVHDDTTDRHLAEQEVHRLNATLEQRIIDRTADLQTSEERFRRVYELSRLGICVVHWDGSYVDANPAYCAMLGYTHEELSRQSLHDVTPAENRDADMDAMTTLRETGFLSQYHKEYLRKDGQKISVVMNGMVVQVPGGEDQVWAFVEDITERTRAEQQLRNSEEKFKSLFELSPLGIARVNWEGQFLQVNRSFAQMIGYSVEEVTQLSYWDVTPREYEEREKQVLESVQETGRFGPFEKEYIHRNGHRVPIVLSGALLHDINGEKQLWGIAQNITERKRAEDELKRALERERELSLLKTNFVSMVSHEFRTPLGIIQSSAEILNDYLEQLDAGERRDQLTSIIRNSRRMAGLMEEVLVLGRLDSDRMQFQPAPLDLPALCRRLVDEVHSSTAHGVHIEFFTADLPAETQADERLLRHILLNLLTNAVKYSEPGQTVSFFARLASNPNQVEFTIQDRGIGIPEAEQERLFNAFQRGSNVGQRPGTGLGLVIVKRCLDLHGGKLALVSHPTQGTTAHVSLPLHPSTAHPAPPHLS